MQARTTPGPDSPLTPPLRPSRGLLAAAAALAVLVSASVADAQTVLLQESFDDAALALRGWYDNVAVTITTEEAANDSRAALAFVFAAGATTPGGVGALRYRFAETETVYLSYWVKYSASWEGSNRPYHPHELYLLTNLEGPYAGPAHTHLTVYIEQNGGVPVLAIQDGLNIDGERIGDDLSRETERRAVGGCNGGTGGQATCYRSGGQHRNGRFWRASEVFFGPEPGPRYRNDWHHVEVLVQLNGIEEGRALPNGVLRYWFDGELVIAHDDVILRTAAHPRMRFNQLVIGPYIGDGSPLEQTFWLDELVLATGRRLSEATADSGGLAAP
jgi:hypothetical protein